MASLAPIPSPLLDLLTPYLTPSYYPITLFLHPHPTLLPLLESYLPRLIQQAQANASSSSSSTTSPPSLSSSRAALIDGVEFGSSVKSYMEEILRQWGTGSKWEGWENFVRALDRNAALVSSEEGAQTQGRLLVVKRVEKLRGGLGFGPGGLASLFARLSEMTSANVTIVFVSTTPWDLLRPLPPTFPDPVILSLPAFSPAQTTAYLNSSSPLPPSSPLLPYYASFVSLLYSTLSSSHPTPSTLAQAATHLWPIYIAPLLAALPSPLPPSLPPPQSSTLLDLHQRSKPAFAAALLNPSSLAASLAPFHLPPLQQQSRLSSQAVARPTLPSLPRMSKFLLLASFLASYNPPKKDLAFFGRGRWEGKGKKRKGGMVRKKANKNKATTAKIPQTLLGPKAFPLDRLIAIFGSLLAEHDRPDGVVGGPRDGHWEEEVGEIMNSVAVRSSISTLVNLHLMQRTSPQDRLEGVTLKTGLGWDEAVGLGRSVGVRIEEFWAGDD